MMTLVAALVGFAVCLLTVKQANRISNRLFRYLAMMAGIVAGLFLCGALAPNNDAAGTAGMIMFGLAAVYTVIFRKKDAPEA
ncbi:MAG: hypothetical protein H6R14_1182 [Proteobacteria bacterium]|nr:hypothetical protein [Pseudomonadota bacterium]